MHKKPSITEASVFELLAACGFEQKPFELNKTPAIGFDIPPLRVDFFLTYQSGVFALLFPYRYPVNAKLTGAETDAGFEIMWHLSPTELHEVYTRLSNEVTGLGGQQSDVARYMHCYVACPRAKDEDFSDELDCYTPADLLNISQHTADLHPDTLSLLIMHRVPMAQIIDFDEKKMHLSLFLEMYAVNFYDHTKV